METFDKIYQKNDNFVFRKIEDETLLVPLRDNVGDMGFLYNLNEVGSFVWQRLDNGEPLRDILDRIQREFEVSCEQAGTDLCEFVRDLEEIGAIIEVEKAC
jgi:hypothetical protein